MHAFRAYLPHTLAADGTLCLSFRQIAARQLPLIPLVPSQPALAVPVRCVAGSSYQLPEARSSVEDTSARNSVAGISSNRPCNKRARKGGEERQLIAVAS